MHLVKSSLGTRGLADTQCICPFCTKESVGQKGADTLCICQTPCPKRGTLPDTWAIPINWQCRYLMYVSGGKLFTKIPANLVFQACISFYRCFQTFGPPTRKILVYTGMLPCLAPSWLQIMQICISFRSRSDLVLDADHALDFFPISLFRRAYRFIVF